MAGIAARAEIGTRTFFSYFASEEELLFPAADARVRAAKEAIATRRPGERPADALLRALANAGTTENGTFGRLDAVRMRLIQIVPAVRGRALQLDARREIAEHLHAAFPDELDAVGAAALVGAFAGAVAGALQALLDESDPAPEDREQLGERVRRATDVALRPWLR